jgi:hypothetical protein
MNERILLVRILLIAAAVERCGAAEKRFQPWGLPSARLQQRTNPARTLHHQYPRRSTGPLPREDADDDDDHHHCEELYPLSLAWRGGSSEEDWYDRAARRQKDRYYPPEDEPQRPRQKNDEQYSYNDGNDGRYHNGGDRDGDDYYGRDDERMERRRSDDVSSTGTGLFSSMLPTSILQGDRKTGMLLLGGGLAVTFLGISLFFNRTLLRLGNLMFIAGVPMTIGPSRTFGYFVQPAKFRATACLGVGIFLVFMGSPVFGIILEFFGLLNLFGNMFPVVWMMAKNLPVLGPILKTTSGEGAAGQSRNRRKQEERYDYDNDPASSPPPYDERQDDYADYNNDQYYDQSSTGEQPSYGRDGYNDDNYNEWDDKAGEQSPSRRYY